MRKTRYLIVSFLLILVLVLVGCTLPPINLPSPTPGPAPAPPTATPSPQPPINPGWTPPTPAPQAPALPSIADVVAQVKPAVIAINTEVVTLDFFNRPFTQQGAGSGWILDKSGIIVTNNHVIQDAKTISVVLDDGRTFQVDPGQVFSDPLNDLAILKVSAQDLPALKIGDSSKMRVGDWVVAIGNALGQGIRATAGIVSRLHVSISVDQGQTLDDLIETNAAINPGNSGGPLVNMAGEVIGITSAKIADVGVEGMGYAISSQTAIPILEALVKNGYVVRPWLGVVLTTVDPFTVFRYRLAVNSGALITEVANNSPAAKGGLKAGDVIVAINGKAVTNADDAIKTIRSSQIGQTVEISYWRGSNQYTAQATLQESPPTP